MPIAPVNQSNQSKYLKNPLVAPVIHYHKRVIATFDALPPKDKVKEVAKRIAIIVVLPLAYIALGILALIGLCLGTRNANKMTQAVSSLNPSRGKKSPSKNPHVEQPHEIVGNILISSQPTVKELAKWMLVSKDSPELQHYLNRITPELAAKHEGIDADDLMDKFKNYDPNNPLLCQGSDLVAALGIAINAAKDNPFQGLKRMQAALFAMKILSQSVNAFFSKGRCLTNLLTIIQHNGKSSVEGYYYRRDTINRVCEMVNALYTFAKTGKTSDTLTSTVTPFNAGLQHKVTHSLEEIFKNKSFVNNLITWLDKDYPNGEIVETWKSVEKLLPHLLVHSKSFQEEQDEKLKKWNDKFKEIAKGDPAKVSARHKAHRVSLYKDTKEACERGFFVKNRLVRLDAETTKRMIENTKLLAPERLKKLDPEPFKTIVEVVDEDTVDLSARYKVDGLNPVALNLANAFRPGGGVEHGAGAQEESIFRRSNYHEALYPHAKGTKTPFYPIPETQVIYTPDVQIFRTAELNYTKPMKAKDIGFAFHTPYKLPFIAAAHFDLCKVSQQKLDELANLDKAFELNPTPENRIDLQNACSKIIESSMGAKDNYENLSKEKMRAILRAAILEGHDSIVLGALGCGAFLNPRSLNAIYWAEVLKEEEFQGRFKKIGFGILSFGSKYLLNAFKKALQPINLEGID